MTRRFSKTPMETQRTFGFQEVSTPPVPRHWLDEAEAALKNAMREGMRKGWGSIEKFAEAFDCSTSEITKPLNGTEGRQVPLWMFIAVLSRYAGAEETLRAANAIGGFEPPVIRREYTDEEELEARRAEARDMGKAGDDFDARVAQRLGVKALRP